jgi:hypothetical protein
MQDPKEPIWNLSIEDLFVTPHEQAAPARAVPVVINLRSSGAPVRLPHLPGFEKLLVYRIEDVEHGRPRFRVRLGFFDSRADAEAALVRLREEYSTAFIASVEDADLPHASEEIAARVRAARAAAPQRRKDDAAAVSGTPELDAALRRHENLKRRAGDNVPPKPKDVFELFPDDHPAVGPARPLVSPTPVQTAAPRPQPAAKQDPAKKPRKPAILSRPAANAPVPAGGADAPVKHSSPARKQPAGKDASFLATGKFRAHGGAKANKEAPREKACETLSAVAFDILNDFDRRRLDGTGGTPDHGSKKAARTSHAAAHSTGKHKAPVKSHAPKKPPKAEKTVPAPAAAAAAAPAAPDVEPAVTPAVKPHAPPVAAAAPPPVALTPESVLDALQTAPRLPVLKAPAEEPVPEVAVDDVTSFVPAIAAPTSAASPANVESPAKTDEHTIADDEPTIEVLAISEESVGAAGATSADAQAKSAAAAPEHVAETGPAAVEFEAGALDLAAPAVEFEAAALELAPATVEFEANALDLAVAREAAATAATEHAAELEATTDDVPVAQAIPEQPVVPATTAAPPAWSMSTAMFSASLDDALRPGTANTSVDAEAGAATAPLGNDDTAFDLEVLALELDSAAGIMVAATDDPLNAPQRESTDNEARASQVVAEQRLAAEELAEAARLEAERKAEAERAAAAAAREEAERFAEEAKRAEAARVAAEQAAEAARLEAERIAEEKRLAEEQRIAAEKAAAEEKRIAAEKAAAEAKRIAAEKVAAEKAAAEKAAADAKRAAEEKLAAEKARLEAERSAREKAAAGKVVPIAPRAAAQKAPAPATATAATAAAPAAAQASTGVNGKTLNDEEAVVLITQAEESLSKWYAVQLSASDEKPNIEQLPQLEIFAEYQLYTAARAVDGRVQHVVRLGFFSNESGALAVAAYMKAFFDNPTTTRVSVAEHDRFSRRKAAPEPEPAAETRANRTHITYADAASARAEARRGDGAQADGTAREGNGEPRRRWTDGAQAATATREPAADKTSTSSIWKRLFR